MQYYPIKIRNEKDIKTKDIEEVDYIPDVYENLNLPKELISKQTWKAKKVEKPMSYYDLIDIPKIFQINKEI